MEKRKRTTEAILVFGIAIAIAVLSMSLATSYADDNPTFTTMGENDETFKFAVIADPHVSIGRKEKANNLRSIVDNIKDEDLEFVIVNGDVSDWTSIPNIELFENIMNKLDIPIFTVVGNHDWRRSYSDAAYGVMPFSCWKPNNKSLEYYQKYLSPKKYSNFENLENGWDLKFGPSVGDFSFNRGPAHIVALNSGYDIYPGEDFGPDGCGLTDAQIDWLEEDLKNEENIFIFLHHPVYRDESKRSSGIISNAENLEYLAKEYDVEAVFNGHVHVFWDREIENVRYVATGVPPGYHIVEFEKDNGFEIRKEGGSPDYKGTFADLNNLKDVKVLMGSMFGQVWTGLQWTHIEIMKGASLAYLVGIFLLGSLILSGAYVNKDS
uniref:Membrane protein containing Metallophosphoesterase domain protein n=1 Tax=uncultured organism TaxID=155900 RepID=M1PQU1_9ZZZZ|nr:membrane protein containing Metallophosphoesterase domain protein [uncultured organism]